MAVATTSNEPESGYISGFAVGLQAGLAKNRLALCCVLHLHLRGIRCRECG